MIPTPDTLLAILIGYALGAIPFGILLTRAAGAGDLRSIGSGNIGATNVLRTGRKGLAAATLLLDLAKGLAAVWIVRLTLPGEELAGAGAALIGHIYPVWLRFRGGKGVATYAGIAFGIGWPLGAVYAGVWIMLLAVTRISALAGMGAAVAMPLAGLVLGIGPWVPLLAALSLLVLHKHRDNIARLRGGTEPKIGGAKPG